MHHPILHMYGPLAIQWYGLMICIGILVSSWLLLRDPRSKLLISTDKFFDLVTLIILASVIGGRLLFLLTSTEHSTWYDILAIWDGGFSVLGSLIAALICIPIYLKIKHIPLLNMMDLLGTYVPLLQSISRLGCYFAGCCYGHPTTVAWGIKHLSDSSQECLVHPTQLYSAFMLLLIFCFMKYVAPNKAKKPGQCMSLYLILTSIERFVVDFWRGDREFFASTGFLSVFSVHQYIAIALCVGACALLINVSMRTQLSNESIQLH